MNVLVGNNHLESIGGSEMYTYDIIKSLSKKEGVSVEYFTFHRGQVSEKIEDELKVSFKSKKKYDLVVASHYPVIEELCLLGPTIQVCHGIVPGLEEPNPLADIHVSVSQEIADSLKRKGFKSEVLLNGLDLQTKRNNKPIHNTVERILSLCQSEKANEVLREICREEGWSFTSFNKNVNPTFYIENVINEHDMVIGLGRSCFDAMACGRPVVIYDQREYNGNLADGYLHPELFDSFVLHNCSGRYAQKTLDKASLKKEILKYRLEDGGELRKIAEQKLDVDKLTDSFIALIQRQKVKSLFIKRWEKIKMELSKRRR